MNAGEEAFIAACVSAPADNGPRLIYGDWLQSHGATALDRTRGELMVVQCRLAEGDAKPTEEKKLRATEKKLAKEVERGLGIVVAEHLGYERGIAESLLFRVDIERGFVTGLEAPSDVLGKLEGAFELAPLLSELRLRNHITPQQSSDIEPALFDSPFVLRLRSLLLGPLGVSDPALVELAACPSLAGLRSLALDHANFSAVGEPHPITSRAIGALTTSPHLTKLQHLRFDTTYLNEDCVRTLVEASWPLESLDLSDSIRGPSVESLSRAANHGRLRRLKLTGTRNVAPEQIGALVSAPHLQELRHLDVEHCDLGPTGLAVMLAKTNLPALEELVAASNDFGDEGAELIARSTAWSKLKRLDLTKNAFHKKGVVTLANGPGLAGVEKLLLNERDSADAREALAHSKTLANTTVYFRGKQIAKARA